MNKYSVKFNTFFCILYNVYDFIYKIMSKDYHPYLPKQVVFHERASRPELYNEHNNRLERVIGEMKEIVHDVVTMKNIIMGEVQKWAEINDRNNYSVHNRIDELMNKINEMEYKQETRYNDMCKILLDIKDRLTVYEVDEVDQIDDEEHE
jgi:hypothetical protein